jgi:hypothetical protein
MKTADLSAELRLFAFYLVNRTLEPDVLPSDLDYSSIFDEPSALEMVFAIWANVITLDENGKVGNAARASRRAAQSIRLFVEPGYVVEPPFEEWEIELHI